MTFVLFWSKYSVTKINVLESPGALLVVSIGGDAGADPGFLKGGQNYKGAPHKYRMLSKVIYTVFCFKQSMPMHNARFPNLRDFLTKVVHI